MPEDSFENLTKQSIADHLSKINFNEHAKRANTLMLLQIRCIADLEVSLEKMRAAQEQGGRSADLLAKRIWWLNAFIFIASAVAAVATGVQAWVDLQKM